MAHFDPKQILTYLYNGKEQTIYVKDFVTIQKPDDESFDQLPPNPSLVGKIETDVNYKAKKVEHQNAYTDTIKIPLLYNVVEKPPQLKTKIRIHICKDLISKKSDEYDVKSKALKVDSSVGGQTTNTIAGDAEIEFEETLLDE